jgi:hypothetical protein
MQCTHVTNEILLLITFTFSEAIILWRNVEVFLLEQIDNDEIYSEALQNQKEKKTERNNIFSVRIINVKP